MESPTLEQVRRGVAGWRGVGWADMERGCGMVVEGGGIGVGVGRGQFTLDRVNLLHP